jgi:hypothetical protein
LAGEPGGLRARFVDFSDVRVDPPPGFEFRQDQFAIAENGRQQIVEVVCHATRKAANVLDGWAILLPARVFKEDLGGYLEDINRRADEGQRFRLYLRVLAAMFWTGVNSFGYFLKEVGKTKSA